MIFIDFRDISRIEGTLKQIGEDGKAAQQIMQEQKMRQSALHEESKLKMWQSDVKLKRAEETNLILAKEFQELKKKFETLDPGSPLRKKGQTMDLLNDLSKIFDDDRTFVGARDMFIGADFLTLENDPIEEYQFKIKLMEHDLQSIQSENNSSVQTVLRLRQELREKKNMHDEVAIKLLNQELAELKRDIKTSDVKIEKTNQEMLETKVKLEKINITNKKNIPVESAESLKIAIDQLEQSNKVAIIELCDLKDKNRHKQQQVEIEKTKRVNERMNTLEQMEKDSIVVGELRNRIMELNSGLKQREAKKLNDQSNLSSIEKSPGPKISKDQLNNLRVTNERMMGEIIRLNGVIKEQKASETSRMQQSFSMSAIQFNDQNDQSFDKTFMSKFK